MLIAILSEGVIAALLNEESMRFWGQAAFWTGCFSDCCPKPGTCGETLPGIECLPVGGMRKPLIPRLGEVLSTHRVGVVGYSEMTRSKAELTLLRPGLVLGASGSWHVIR
jgi:hypothetical protein